MHTTPDICKTPKTGTLLTIICRSLNYNKIQLQIKQRNKGKNTNNDTFYLAKFSGCWERHDKAK